jgi:predicted RNase H-like HicB family nuclease
MPMSKKLSYKVVLEPCAEGGFTVYVPSLPGCISQGESRQEALDNIKEAILAWIEVSREYGDAVPPGDVVYDLVEVEV